MKEWLTNEVEWGQLAFYVIAVVLLWNFLPWEGALILTIFLFSINLQ